MVSEFKIGDRVGFLARDGMHQGEVLASAAELSASDGEVVGTDSRDCGGDFLMVREMVGGSTARHWMLCSGCDTVVKRQQ